MSYSSCCGKMDLIRIKEVTVRWIPSKTWPSYFLPPAHFILFHIGKGNQCPPLMCSDLSRGVTTASSSTFDLSFIPAALPDTTPKGICITLENAMLNFGYYLISDQLNAYANNLSLLFLPLLHSLQDQQITVTSTATLQMMKVLLMSYLVGTWTSEDFSSIFPTFSFHCTH